MLALPLLRSTAKSSLRDWIQALDAYTLWAFNPPPPPISLRSRTDWLPHD